MLRRVNHVKNVLAHGEFAEWIENKIGIHYRKANRMMTVAKQIPNVSTLKYLGATAKHVNGVAKRKQNFLSQISLIPTNPQLPHQTIINTYLYWQP
ncbi:TPA: DUF3102 domain-containing protein [Streptococcus agalactiae]